MEKRFMSLKRVLILEESISFLSEYVPVEGEVHHIGDSIDQRDEKLSLLLEELGQLHLREKEILQKFQEAGRK